MGSREMSIKIPLHWLSGNGTIPRFYRTIPSPILSYRLPLTNICVGKNHQLERGLDVVVLGNRIAFTADVYRRVSDDLIGMRSLPGENGFDYSTMNWAKLTNRGYELSLSTVNVKTKDFRWVMDFNLAHNKSKDQSAECQG